MSLRDRVSGRLLPQWKLGARAGAVRTIVARLAFYRGTMVAVLVSLNTYNVSPRVQSLFPTYWSWLVALCLIGGAAFIFEYSFAFKAEQEFKQRQAFDEDFSPVMQKLADQEERLDRIESEVTDND